VRDRSHQKHPATAKFALVRSADREEGISGSSTCWGIIVKGKEVLLKPNFNTADAYPGSTHNDTPGHLNPCVSGHWVRERSPSESGAAPRTLRTCSRKSEFTCSAEARRYCHQLRGPARRRLGAPVKPRLCSWRNGFDVARPVMDSNGIVTTCCLKTHAYGGVFTMALKLSVGMTRKRNMAELHTSFLSMRKMIAEINAAYRPALVLLDGIEAFTDDGGPARGTRKRADVLLAETDRIAIDAVGLAILKDLGSNRNIYGHEDIRSGADQPRRRAGARRRPSGEHRTRDRRPRPAGRMPHVCA